MSRCLATEPIDSRACASARRRMDLAGRSPLVCREVLCRLEKS